MTVHLAQNAEADALLDRDPLALLVGMLLDQQVTIEWAFTAPLVLVDRLGHDLDAQEIAAYDPDAFAALASRTPAIHRFPAAMARRVQALCQLIVDEYGGDPEAIWRDAPDGAELLRRLGRLPGFGKQKAQIFLALLGKQRGVQPPGWREAAGAYGADGSRHSVADITDEVSLGEVRAYKQELKAAAKAAPPRSTTKKAATKKATTRKAAGTAKKTTAGRGTAGKATTKKSTAKKSPAKKSPAKKSAATVRATAR